jgi:hypothetical protein
MKLPRRVLVRTTFACLALAGGLTLARAEMQTLTDKQGRSLKADVISVTGDKVKIKREDGQTFDLALSNLSDDDQSRLKAWAKQEAAKSLPADALVVEFSRGKFDTIKKDVDVTLVGGGVVKDGMTITEEKWGYAITLTNRTPQPIENLRSEYILFATVDSVHSDDKGMRKKRYNNPIETIPTLGKITFRTETISAIKTKYNGNIVSGKTGDNKSRETLFGIWIRMYRGDQLVYENSMPGTLRTTEKWTGSEK